MTFVAPTITRLDPDNFFTIHLMNGSLKGRTGNYNLEINLTQSGNSNISVVVEVTIANSSQYRFGGGSTMKRIVFPLHQHTDTIQFPITVENNDILPQQPWRVILSVCSYDSSSDPMTQQCTNGSFRVMVTHGMNIVINEFN